MPQSFRQPRGTCLVMHTAAAGTLGVATVQAGRVRQECLAPVRPVRGGGVSPLALLNRLSDWRRVSEVAVVRGMPPRSRTRSGPASVGFSQLRSGIVTGNALGYALGVPVRGILAPPQPWRKFLVSLTHQLAAARPRRLVTPAYTQAPHISRPKRPRP